MIPTRVHGKFAPQKTIKIPEDVPSFTNGDTCKQFLIFLEKMQESVRGKNISLTNPNPKFHLFEDYFKDLKNLLKNTPPEEGKMRFGNTAFRKFCIGLYEVNKHFVNKLMKVIPLTAFKSMIQEMESKGEIFKIKSEEVEEAVTEELKTYLDESFGNEVNII